MGDGNNAYFVRVQVYSPSNVLLTTITLPNIGGGRYRANYTMPSVEGVYIFKPLVYTDSLFTVLAQDIWLSNGEIEARQIDKLANLDETISSRESDTNAETRKQAIIDAADNADGRAV